jgi:hypothetical protein
MWAPDPHLNKQQQQHEYACRAFLVASTYASLRVGVMPQPTQAQTEDFKRRCNAT